MTMVELLLQAERALSVGMVDQAEALYRRVAEADPRNAIALVGLARVALERADDREAYVQARRAAAVDPENAAARRLVERLEEVFVHRGEPVPMVDTIVSPPATEPARMPKPARMPPSEPPPAPSASGSPAGATASRPRRGLLRRLLGRGGRA
jgi:tetratricopeptide (TPR) repeat protein